MLNKYIENSMCKRHLRTYHLLLVKNIAQQFKNKSNLNVDYDDLTQSGMVGLLEALEAFDATQSTNIDSFVYSRIYRSMLKEIYKGDWTPKRFYKIIQKSFEAREKIENITGKKASDAEIADEMDMSLAKYIKLISHYQNSRLLHFDESKLLHDADEGNEMIHINILSEFHINPINKFNIDSLKVRLIKAIDKLPKQEKLVLSLYYDEELLMKTIGNILGVSESRVCQVHKHALDLLRQKFIH